MSATHWIRLTGAVLAAALIFTAVAQAKPRVRFTSAIGAPQQTGCPDATSDAWPMLAADPASDGRLRGVYQQGGVTASVLAASDDGGRTWRRQALPVTSCSGGPVERDVSVNPQVAVGRNGTLYYGQSWVGFRNGIFSYDVLTHRGDGVTGAPQGDDSAQNAAVVADPDNPDRVSMLFADADEVPNPFTYATFVPSRIRFATSSDGGRTWSGPVTVSESPPGTAQVNTRMVRASDGALVGVFDRLQFADAPAFLAAGANLPTELFAVRSTDGGATWSGPVKIGEPYFTTVADPDHTGPADIKTAAGSAKPALAAGPDGLVGAVWSEGGQSLRMTVSRDGGTTWSAPGAAAHGVSPIQPAIAFDGRGRTGIFFYDFADDVPGDGAWHITPRLKTGGRTLALSEPFDLHATNRCTSSTPVPTPFTQSCDLAVDFMALGVYQSVVGLRRGFGVGFTVGPPLATDGYTDARFTRVR